MPTIAPQSRARESGFTLVEVLVALALTGVVVALMFGALLTLSDSAERSNQRTKAQRATVLAVERLTADLRSAQAPQREAKYVNGADGLRRILLLGDRPQLEVHDLLLAGPNRMVFFAEVKNHDTRVDGPRPAGDLDTECVEWAVRPTGALVRRVYPYTRRCQDVVAGAPVNAPLQDHEVMPAPERARASSAMQIPSIFSYRVSRTSFPVIACTETTVRPGAAGITDLRTLDQVVGVSLDLRSFVARNGARGDQELVSAVSLAGRQMREYRYGIGCSA